MNKINYYISVSLAPAYYILELVLLLGAQSCDSSM